MPGKPFQSKLEPHLDFILEARRKRQTWQAIADELAAQGVTATAQAIHGFVKRRLKRRYALGAAPVALSAVTRPQPKPSRPKPPELTEITPPASDAGPDPLTLPPRKKPKWNQI